MIDILIGSLVVGAAAAGLYWGLYDNRSKTVYLITRIKARHKIKPRLLAALQEAPSLAAALETINRYDPDLHLYLERHGLSKGLFEYLFSELAFVRRNAPEKAKPLFDAYLQKYEMVNSFLAYLGVPYAYPLEKRIKEKISGENLGRLRLIFERGILQKLIKAAAQTEDKELQALVTKYVKLCEFRFLLRKKLAEVPFERVSKHLIHPGFFRNAYQQPMSSFVQWFLKSQRMEQSLKLYMQEFSLSDMEAGFDRDFHAMFERLARKKPMSISLLFLYLLRLDAYLSSIREILLKLRWKEWKLL